MDRQAKKFKVIDIKKNKKSLDSCWGSKIGRLLFLNL